MRPCRRAFHSVGQRTVGGKTQVNPANISRVRGDLPAGYEVADLGGPASPAAFWGFGPGWVTEPPQCGLLAGPPTDDATSKGWSASGPGGIVYAVVAGIAGIADDIRPRCARRMRAVDGGVGEHDRHRQPIERRPSKARPPSAWPPRPTTVVEGGTETRSHADTFTAYLGDYVAFVTVVTDPGSPNPALGQDFAAELLVKTVSALRG